MKAVAAALLAAGLVDYVTAKELWGNKELKYITPSLADNTHCNEKQKQGYNWGDLEPGPFKEYDGLGFDHYECRDAHLDDYPDYSRAIYGHARKTYDNSPRFSWDNDKGFSASRYLVQPVGYDKDIDIVFDYERHDGTKCKHVSPCGPKGTYISNTQCGGAKSVTVHLPDHVDIDELEINIYGINFDCEPAYAYEFPPDPHNYDDKNYEYRGSEYDNGVHYGEKDYGHSDGKYNDGIDYDEKDDGHHTDKYDDGIDYDEKDDGVHYGEYDDGIHYGEKDDGIDYDGKDGGVHYDEKDDGIDYDEKDDGVHYGEKDDGIDYDEKDDGIDYDEKDDGIHYDEKDDGIDYDEKDDGIDYDEKDDGIHYDEKDDGIHYDEKDDGIDYNEKDDGIDYNEKDDGHHPDNKDGVYRPKGYDDYPKDGGYDDGVHRPKDYDNHDKVEEIHEPIGYDGGHPEPVHPEPIHHPVDPHKDECHDDCEPFDPKYQIDCPEILPRCFNTWLPHIGCKDNTDINCFCGRHDFIDNVAGCIGAHEEMYDRSQDAYIYMAGICKEFIPKNPTIVAVCPPDVKIAPPAPEVHVEYPDTLEWKPVVVDTEVVRYPVEYEAVPQYQQPVEYQPEQFEKYHLSTTVTVPQVTFQHPTPAPVGAPQVYLAPGPPPEPQPYVPEHAPPVPYYEPDLGVPQPAPAPYPVPDDVQPQPVPAPYPVDPVPAPHPVPEHPVDDFEPAKTFSVQTFSGDKYSPVDDGFVPAETGVQFTGTAARFGAGIWSSAAVILAAFLFA